MQEGASIHIHHKSNMVDYTETKLTFTAKLWVHDRREPHIELQVVGVHNNNKVAFKHYSANMVPFFSLSNQAMSMFSDRRMRGHLRAEFPIPGADADYWPATAVVEEKKYDLKFVFC